MSIIKIVNPFSSAHSNKSNELTRKKVVKITKSVKLTIECVLSKGKIPGKILYMVMGCGSEHCVRYQAFYQLKQTYWGSPVSLSASLNVVYHKEIYLSKALTCMKIFLYKQNKLFYQGDGYLWPHCCMNILYISHRSLYAPTYSF